MDKKTSRWVFGSFQENQALANKIRRFGEFEGCGQRQVPLGITISQSYLEAAMKGEESVAQSYMNEAEDTELTPQKLDEIHETRQRLTLQCKDNLISFRMWTLLTSQKLGKCKAMMMPQEAQEYEKTLTKQEKSLQEIGDAPVELSTPPTHEQLLEQAYNDMVWLISRMVFAQSAIDRNLPVCEEQEPHTPHTEASFATLWDGEWEIE